MSTTSWYEFQKKRYWDRVQTGISSDIASHYSVVRLTLKQKRRDLQYIPCI